MSLFKIDECNIPVVLVKRGMEIDSEYEKIPSDEGLGLRGTYTFEYSYPLKSKAQFTELLNPLTSGFDLLLIGKQHYERIYSEEASDVPDPGLIPGMLNRDYSNGRHGIWGHDLEDLFFEGIEVDTGARKISFLMGS
jgi:hypothetical protein